MSGGGKGSKSVTVGYRYYAGMHLALCHGPIDSLNRIVVGERTAWSGSLTSSGRIAIDQPNLFGKCKRGSLQWQFGRYVNDFNLSYSDPSIRQTRVSGTVSAYRSRARYNIADLGRSLRTGGTFELGFPIPNSPRSTLRLSYGGEFVSFGSSGLLGEQHTREMSERADTGCGVGHRMAFGVGNEPAQVIHG